MKVNYNTIALHFIYLPSKTEGTQTFIPFVKWPEQLEMKELQCNTRSIAFSRV